MNPSKVQRDKLHQLTDLPNKYSSVHLDARLAHARNVI